MTKAVTKNDIASKLLNGLTGVSANFPLLLAFCVCSPFGARLGVILITVLCCLGITVKYNFISFLAVLLALCAAAEYGVGVAAAGGLIACIIAAAAIRLKPDRSSLLSAPVTAGLMVGTAFSLTALQTTNYFGIGAVGANVLEMLTSYRSLGFHANWRGVFYGTVVMVIMITFPRGFKNFSKKISPAFVALGVTAVLNLFLNPTSRPSAINEVGSALGQPAGLGALALRPADIPAMLLTSAAFLAAILLALSEHSTGAKGKAEGSRFSFLSGAFALIISSALFLSGIVERMPIHSLAVVIIVGAWQSVEWGLIGKSIRSGAASGILMIFSAALPVFIGVHAALAILALLSAALRLRDNRRALSRS